MTLILTEKILNKNHVLISVVIPTYNRASLIVDALDSVKSQGYRPLEVIVVDDGSSDETEAVVKAWEKSVDDSSLVLKYVYQANQGGNVARNRGIAEADGVYIAFLDSDDAWHSSKLLKQIELFQDDDVGGVYCGLQHVDLESDRITEPELRSYPCGNILAQMLVRDVTSPTSCWMIRKSVFDTVGVFDTDLQARQDWDMWIRVSADYKIACVAEVLVNYGEHPGARTASNPQKEIDAYQRIMDKYAYLRTVLPLSVRQSAKAAYYRRRGRVEFHYRHSFFRALFYYLKAIFTWPFVFDSYAALAGLFFPASLRTHLHHFWNKLFGKTRFAIRSH